MAVPKIASNGFGRIGRIVTRIAKMRRHFDVVAINDLTDPEHLAYLFKYDSVHGVYPGDVRLDGETMVIDNDPFQVLSERDPAKLPWGALGVDYVIESTGKFLRIQELQHHLDAGAQRVIVTVPTRDDLEVVFQKWRWPFLHRPSKGIAVDKQANHDVMNLSH